MTMWKNLNSQDATSPTMKQLMFFHDHSMMILILIATSIFYFMIYMSFNFYINRFLLNKQNIEIIWTVLPMLMLIFIALPSIHLLYLMDGVSNPILTIKSIGHQWYWMYEYSDFKNIEFDSYMNKDIKINSFRVLDVDNNLILPTNTHLRMLITSTDVIHSWAMPALGKKIDAIPGRLNQINLLINQPGILFGQCSEICGANHSFMPIVIESIPMNFFIK
uniref:Cytochrome c oxidase subunit 2 n=1 Tax=Cimbex luteus TaxID=1384799 RepID=A0A7T1FV30_9HYME|nr:cytochrome c oxidase subunit II [Cimbex luteus]QPM99414.2 cytochrome c oxidase subunit II [Cimbex luteus]UXW64279.1 cytochrome c oxidase subunit II [Cimbex luteus]